MLLRPQTSSLACGDHLIDLPKQYFGVKKGDEYVKQILKVLINETDDEFDWSFFGYGYSYYNYEEGTVNCSSKQCQQNLEIVQILV